MYIHIECLYICIIHMYVRTCMFINTYLYDISVETITNGSSTPESSSKESKIHKWSTSDIVQWLDSAGLGQFSEAFVKHAIDGECLLSLSQSDLKEDMGIQALGHRHRILRAIKHLREDVNN